MQCIFQIAASFSDISQGNVVTYLRCGGIFKYDFVASLPLSLSVKELWKSVNIWRSYGQELCHVFLTQGVVTLMWVTANASCNGVDLFTSIQFSCVLYVNKPLVYCTKPELNKIRTKVKTVEPRGSCSGCLGKDWLIDWNWHWKLACRDARLGIGSGLRCSTIGNAKLSVS